MNILMKELAAWQDEQIGKPCPKHPNHKIKRGKWVNWCGVKTAFGWCDGGWPTEEWINNYRQKETLQ
jgi:hypothetical protein